MSTLGEKLPSIFFFNACLYVMSYDCWQTGKKQQENDEEKKINEKCHNYTDRSDQHERKRRKLNAILNY